MDGRASGCIDLIPFVTLATPTQSLFHSSTSRSFLTSARNQDVKKVIGSKWFLYSFDFLGRAHNQLACERSCKPGWKGGVENGSPQNFHCVVKIVRGLPRPLIAHALPCVQP